MLNETHRLRQSLEACGFELPDRHPDMKQPGRSPGLRVGLTPGGRPGDVELLDAGAVCNLWTIREGKHNSFPVVKVQTSLLAVPSEAPLRQRLAQLGRGPRADAQRLVILREALNQFPVK